MFRYVKINVMIESQDKAPFFVGSMFRGAMGNALKSVVCINPTYTCEGCFSAKECVYFDFYEEKNVFHPYRLDIQLQPKNHDFSLYLFEGAISSLPYILSAIQNAAQEQGFGKERKKMLIKQMAVFNTIIYDGKSFLPLDVVKPKELVVDSFCQDIEIEFVMPLRIKENNQLAKTSVALHTLVSNIHRRYCELKGKEAERMNYRVEGEVVKSSLKFVEMKRYSNRQQKGMNMGGLKGSMTIRGIDKRSYEYLKIGEVIGVGKQTVFGLGSYILKEIK